MFATDQLIGARYRLRRRIAAGGMGEVWRASDERLLREVALKVLRPEHADDTAFRARLQIEAQSAASLNCDNVVGVYDWGEQTDDTGRTLSYTVMELVVGDTVAEFLARAGRLSPYEVAQILAQAASGLAAAHDQGLVHRDIKPANLLRRTDGRVKVADFGIARAKDGSALTTTGTLVGTARYLSPEQVRGNPAIPPSDIYSLGIVAYQCLTGDVPFRGDGDVATATARLNNPVPPLPVSTPPVLNNLVMAMLDPDPALRPTAPQLAHTAAQSATLAPAAVAATQLVPTVAVPYAETAAVPIAPPPSLAARASGSRRYYLAGAALLLLLVGVFLVPSMFNGLPSSGDAGATTPRASASTASTPPDSARSSGTSPNVPSTRATTVAAVRTPPAKKSRHALAAAATRPTPPGHAPGHGAKKADKPQPGLGNHGHGPKGP